MKKIIVLLVCVVMIFGLSACGKDDQSGSGGSAPKEKDAKLTDVMKDICKDVDLPENEVIKLDKETYEEYSFVKWSDGIEAVASEGLVTTLPHSLVLIKTDKGDGEKIAKEISEKANLTKWICVKAELGKVLYTDNYVLMIMTYKNAYDGLKANFEKVVGSDEVKAFDIKDSKSK